MGNRKLMMNRNITVINAQHSDGGIYKCLAYDLANDHKEVIKLVKIYGLCD